MSLLVVGTVAYDSVETPFGKADDALGGSAMYFAAAASYFTKVRMVGVVGADFEHAKLDFLKNRGVEMDGIEVQEGGKTFRWAGRYHHDLNTRDTLDTQLNVLATFDPKVPTAWQASKFVFLANVDPILQRKVLDQVDGKPLVIADTMNFWIDSMRDELVKTLGQVDVLIINDEEARMLTDEPNLVKAATAIKKMGPHTLVIKKGEHGAVLFHPEGVFAIPGYPLEDVHDPTGAGDTFAGGFYGHLAKAGNTDFTTMKQAVLVGSAMASYCVESFGPGRLEALSQEAIDHRIKAFQNLTHAPF